jgi:hypothetical protein
VGRLTSTRRAGYHLGAVEAWRTYTPDGRVLEVEYAGGEWIATCGGSRAVGATALEAIRAAVGSSQASIGSGETALEPWLAEHAAQLESEAG